MLIAFFLMLTVSSESARTEEASPVEASTAPVVSKKPTLSDFKKFRDPFRVPTTPVDERENVSELEKYATNDFKLVGIITGPVRMRAMIVSPNGKSHTVSEKMRIGQLEGVIKRITTQSVIVQENIVNPLGEVEKVDTEIVFATTTATTGSTARSPMNSGGVRR